MSPDDGLLERTDVLSEERVLDGKYELGAQIGEGGMGSIHVAKHTQLGNTVAVKLLGEAFVEHPTAQARFKREARALAATKHENIVHVIDFGTDPELGPFLVMEHLEGESLHSLLGRKGALPANTAVEIVCQMLEGLEAVHESHIIHRDLKPANVFLVQRAAGKVRVKILDFGISKFLDPDEGDHKTATGAIVGTPKYLAPEQITHKHEPDARTDIYAVGVCLYRMLTGRLPYSARDRAGLFDEIVQSKIVHPHKRKPDLPDALVEVVLCALATDVDQRFASAGDMLAALREIYPEGHLTGETHESTGIKLSVHPPPRLGSGTASVPQSSEIRRSEAASEAETRADAPRARVSDPTPPLPSMPGGAQALTTMTTERRGGGGALMIGVVLVALLAAGGGWFLATQNAEGETAANEEPEPEQDQGANAPPPLEGTAIRYGVQQYLPEAQVRERHLPIATYLEQELNRPVEVVVVADYSDLAQRAVDGDVELAALSAYHYVRARRGADEIALLARATTAGGDSYSGVIIARDPSLRTLQSLDGKAFCFVSPTSTSGYLYPRALFRREGLDPDAHLGHVRFGGDHLSTLRALDSGACEAAAVAASFFYEGAQHGIAPQQFHVVATTERIPFDAYCAGTHVDEETRGRLQAALLALTPNSEESMTVLEGGDITGFLAASDADYEPVRDILEYLEIDAQTAAVDDGDETDEAGDEPE